MIISELKRELNSDKIIKLLETMGCQSVKFHGGYITSTRGNGGDNSQGVVCYLTNGEFSCIMPTTPKFDAFNVKDIITVVQVVKELNFPRAVKFICSVCGIDYYQEPEIKSGALEWLKRVESGLGGNFETEVIKQIDENVLNQFVKYPHFEWIKEGIVPQVCEQFQIGYDIETNSITIPIRDSIGNLVGVKCRSLKADTDNKYWYLYPTSKSRLLYGEVESYSAIQREGFVIVVEGEKSVLKGHSFGIKNIVAISGKKISKEQAENLLRMNVPIVLAMDSDVSIEEIELSVKELIYPVQTVPIYLLQDKFGLYIGQKDSPADCKEYLTAYKENMLLFTS